MRQSSEKKEEREGTHALDELLAVLADDASRELDLAEATARDKSQPEFARTKAKTTHMSLYIC